MELIGPTVERILLSVLLMVWKSWVFRRMAGGTVRWVAVVVEIGVAASMEGVYGIVGNPAVRGSSLDLTFTAVVCATKGKEANVGLHDRHQLAVTRHLLLEPSLARPCVLSLQHDDHLHHLASSDCRLHNHTPTDNQAASPRFLKPWVRSTLLT